MVPPAAGLRRAARTHPRRTAARRDQILAHPRNAGLSILNPAHTNPVTSNFTMHAAQWPLAGVNPTALTGISDTTNRQASRVL